MATLIVTTTSDSGDNGRLDTDLATDMSDGGGLSLREAVGRASSGDTITFGATLDGQAITVDSVLSISVDLTIDGDIDGDGIPNVVISANGNNQVFNLSGADNDVTLNGLTIQEGSATSGGAIYLQGTNVTVSNSVIQNSSASGSGGAIVAASGTLTINDSNFNGNSANTGGAVYVGTAVTSVTISNSSFVNNSADLQGGGLYFYGVEQDASTFADNITITNTVIAQNSSTSSNGGGVMVVSSDVTFENSTLTGNSSAGHGANLHVTSAGTVTFSDSIVASSGSAASSINNVGGYVVFEGSDNTTVISSLTGDTGASRVIGTPTTETDMSQIFDGTVVVNGITGGSLSQVGNVYYTTASSSGVASGLGAVPNHAPSLDLMGAADVDYTENDFYKLIAGSGTVSDADGDADWDGGTISAQITGNPDATDQIILTGNELFRISGTDITYGGEVIGTVSIAEVDRPGGVASIATGSTALTVTFNSNATNAAVQVVMRNFQYSNSSDDPAAGARTITVTVTDANGNSSSDTVGAYVTTVEDDPSITLTADDPTFTEDGTAVAVYSGADISPVEAGQTITGFSFYVRNVADGADEILTVDGTDITLTAGTNGTTTTNSLSYTVTVSGDMTQVALSGGTLSSGQASGIVNSVTYRNESDTPSTGDVREVSFSDISDSAGSTASGGTQSDITVVAANDAPTSTASSPLIDEDETYTFTVSDFNFSDVDGDSLVSVRIDTLATVDGNFQLSGADVEAGDVIEVADITAGNLTFVPENVVDPEYSSGVLLEFTHSVNDGTTFAASPTRIQVEVDFIDEPTTASGIPSDISVGIETLSDLDLSGVSFADADSTTIQVNLSVDTGTLSYANGADNMLKIRASGVQSEASLTSSVDGDVQHIQIHGTASNIAAYLSDLSSIQYTSAEDITGDNAATLTISTTDEEARKNVTLGTVNLDIGTSANRNDPPTSLRLSSASVDENAGGAVIGTLSARDPEGGSISFQASDSRFEVVGNTLKLKDGVSLDYEEESSVGLDVTASDPFGATYTRTFTIAVNDIGEHATTDGADTVTGGDVDDNIASGGGDDFITTGNGRDTIDGGDGDDDVSGGNDDDLIDGGRGNDIVNGGSGSDTLRGGEGDDTVSAGDDNDLVFAGKGDEGNDTIAGDNGDDTLGGGKGGDVLDGGDGNDLLWGSAGDDTVEGGAGSDMLFNGAGSDAVDGGAGSDTLWAGSGDDTLTGGDGADTFIFGATNGNDTIADFDVSEDTLDLSFLATGFENVSDMQSAATATTQGGQAGVLLDLGGDESVFLVGLTVSDLASINLTL
ncbi:beta strand repeat-containing protein [Kordiimonas sp.]|uniref:beta strand repeat-containing protein n=1 Tax=Kordiimonas sp. TaxID=1970157 RepID=UPI003A92685B